MRIDFVAVGVLLLGGAFAYAQWFWWRIHGKHGAERTNGEVDDLRDVLDRWPPALVVGAAGTWFVLYGIAYRPQ